MCSDLLQPVSIIVPVYNSEDYLKACVESILAQTYTRLEVLLVNDGSTDRSGKICDELAERDHRVKVIHQSNGGIASAQNAGLDAMTGDFVTFCDNDDLMSPHLVERLVELFELEDVDMSCCRWRNVGASVAAAEMRRHQDDIAGDSIVFDQPARAYQQVFSAALRRVFRAELTYFSEANWGKLYAAHLFEGVRFPEGRYAQDVAVAMTLYAKMRRVASCEDQLYYWLQRADSVSHSLRKTAYYHDIVLAHAESFRAALSAGIAPARAYYGLTALRYERLSVTTSAEKTLYAEDRELVKSLRNQLTLRWRVYCIALSWLRRAETVVYDRTVHRRR